MVGFIGVAMPDEEKLRIREYYDLLSDSYDELYGIEQGKKHERILESLGRTKFGLLIEVGCGTGAMLERATANYLSAVGTDISPKMLRKARNRTERETTDFVLSDGSALPFRDGVSDLVMSISVLKSDSKHQFEELSRIAKHDGTILLTLFPADNPPGETDSKLAFYSSRKVQLTKKETLHMVRKSCPMDSGKVERGFSFL